MFRTHNQPQRKSYLDIRCPQSPTFQLPFLPMDSKPLKCKTFVIEKLSKDIISKYTTVALCVIKMRIPVSGRFSLVTVNVLPFTVLVMLWLAGVF